MEIRQFVAATQHIKTNCQRLSKSRLRSAARLRLIVADLNLISSPRRTDMTLHPDSLAYPPRGMSRDEAARYIGVGTTKFDEMVADRRMPRPKRVDGRVIWDRLKIEAAFTDLPEEKKVNPWDSILSDPR